MEKNLNKHLEKVIKGNPSICKIQIIDRDGMNLGYVNDKEDSTVPNLESGILSSIYKIAQSLSPKDENPLIAINCENLQITAANDNQILTAIYKITETKSD